MRALSELALATEATTTSVERCAQMRCGMSPVGPAHACTRSTKRNSGYVTFVRAACRPRVERLPAPLLEFGLQSSTHSGHLAQHFGRHRRARRLQVPLDGAHAVELLLQRGIAERGEHERGGHSATDGNQTR
jgi:hypothetical protein